MFSIKHFQDQNNAVDYLELINLDNTSYAKIDLTFGGSLQELKLFDKTIISSKHIPNYKNTFASSILFPFTNRIENGKYHFNHKIYQFENNEVDRFNALHGLVYDKTFELIGQESSEKKASISIAYDEVQPVSGFPYKYSVVLQYVLTENSLDLIVEIENKDQNAFPFSLGWHPYFKTSDLYNSLLKINSQKKILVNDKMIPNGEEEIDWDGFLKIEEKTFDDCFVLNSNMVEFKTPEYHLDFIFSTEENYLQLYTPKNRESIAIEPQTAPANSFNNKIGFQILQPKKSYKVCWKINLK